MPVRAQVLHVARLASDQSFTNPRFGGWPPGSAVRVNVERLRDLDFGGLAHTSSAVDVAGVMPAGKSDAARLMRGRVADGNRR